MKLETFFENFELLSNAPNGVQKLRELILQLAVQGKLVPQDPNDEPASVLLEKIRAEKERLIREKKIKRDRGVFSEKIQKPFDIPETWEWAYLGNLVDYGGGKKFNAEDVPQKAWLLELEDIEKDTSLIIQRIKAEERRPQSTKTFFDKGCVLYGKLRPYLNKVVVADAEGYCTTEILALRVFSDFSAHYLMYVLKSPFFLAYVNSKMYGMKMPRLGTEDGQSALIPVPPFKEQTRIVAKVEQLMSLCDELEARKQRRDNERIALNATLLDELLAAESDKDFQKCWQRICDNFHLLYDNSENVGKLRQAILELAVRGKLVPQHPDDEPASVLLEKIRAEKERLIREKKVKREKLLPPIREDEMPYEIPKGWVWVRLEEIRKTIEYGTSFKASSEHIGIPILRMNNIQNGTIVYDNIKYVSSTIKDLPRLYLKKNDILFNRTNSYELVGKTGLFKENDDLFTFASYLIRVTLFTEYLEPEYINIVMNSLWFRQTQIEPEITQQCGQANFNGTKLAATFIVLPPYQEQKRILTKVEQLMSLCDQLETKIRQAQSDIESIMTETVGSLISHETFKNHWREYESNSVKDIKEKQRQNAGKRFVAGFQDGNF